MGGVCATEDSNDDVPVLVQKDMKTVQEEMARYKENMQKEERARVRSISRYGTAKEKIQKFKKRHGDEHNETKKFLDVDQTSSEHIRGDSFTRASQHASAERFAEFKSKIDEEKRRSRRPIEDHREDVQRKMKEISDKGHVAKPSKSHERTSKKKNWDDEFEMNEKRDAKRNKSKKRTSGETKRKKDKDKKKSKKNRHSDDHTSSEKRSKSRKKKA